MNKNLNQVQQSDDNSRTPADTTRTGTHSAVAFHGETRHVIRMFAEMFSEPIVLMPIDGERAPPTSTDTLATPPSTATTALPACPGSAQAKSTPCVTSTPLPVPVSYYAGVTRRRSQTTRATSPV